ncbi:MAG: FxsA family protein [Solirubrobacteraceae bacterium]|nr:FxsA family protein [Solirubrobacteraceae bacterium]
MPVLLVLVLGLVLEVLAVIAVADLVGAAATVLLLLGGSILGGWVLRATGARVWVQATDEIRAGRSPADTVVDGARRVLGGFLLLVPGLLSSMAGLLVISPVGRVLRRPLRSSMGRVRPPAFATMRMGGSGPWGPGPGRDPWGPGAGPGPWGPDAGPGPWHGDDVVEGQATEWPDGRPGPSAPGIDPPDGR